MTVRNYEMTGNDCNLITVRWKREFRKRMRISELYKWKAIAANMMHKISDKDYTKASSYLCVFVFFNAQENGSTGKGYKDTWRQTEYQHQPKGCVV